MNRNDHLTKYYVYAYCISQKKKSARLFVTFISKIDSVILLMFWYILSIYDKRVIM